MQRWLAIPVLGFLLATAGSTLPARAQTADNVDAPPLIAGRIALADGDAQIWRIDEEASNSHWDSAEINDVVSAGTGLYTGADGRSEIRVGPHTFRLAADSRGGFVQLDYSDAVFDLEYGTLNIRLARPEYGERAAVTVNGMRFDLTGPGRYRIDATANGPARLTVFEGHGTARSANLTLGVAASQAIVMNAGGAGYSFEQPANTDFDLWAAARDAQYSEVRSAQYVSPYMTGYEALDSHGDWVPDATYGTVWYPRAVPVGWAPYRYGQWRWVRPWGWTWVDNAPWGYAPFHYGRWVMVGPRWCWVPGGYVRRPVWAPALVRFVGPNASVSIGFGGPVVGWYPLAPWHRYEPHYRHNPRYVTVINQTVINAPPRGVPRTINQGPGATMVPGPRFRDPVMKVALPVNPRPEQLRPVAPPPRDVAPAPRSNSPKFADRDDRRGRDSGAPPARTVPPSAGDAPMARGRPPTRVTPPMVADTIPGRGLGPAPALPGNDPAPLAQPPGLKRVEPPARIAPPRPPMRDEQPRPRPHLPSDQIPPGQARPVNPAEPARFPPGAPPTIRAPMAPAARPVAPTPGSPPGLGRSAPASAAPIPGSPPGLGRSAPAPAVPGSPPGIGRSAPTAPIPGSPPGLARPTPAAVAPPQPAAAPAPQPKPLTQKQAGLRDLPEQARGGPRQKEK